MYNYLGNNQFGNYYQPYGQMYNQMQVKQNEVQNFPFSLVRFGTLDEIKGQLVSPNKPIMFIKSDFSEFYIKSVDNYGNVALDTFKCSKLNENPSQTETSKFDPKEFVKSEDLKGFIKKDELEGILLEIDKIKKHIGVEDEK